MQQALRKYLIFGRAGMEKLSKPTIETPRTQHVMSLSYDRIDVPQRFRDGHRIWNEKGDDMALDPVQGIRVAFTPISEIGIIPAGPGNFGDSHMIKIDKLLRLVNET